MSLQERLVGKVRGLSLPSAMAPASITIAPIEPGSLDEWRAFYAELSGPRRSEWAESQRRRGVRREAVWLMHDPPRAVVLVEGPDPGAAAVELEASTVPFDVWFREQLDGLTGATQTATAVFDSKPRRGTWRPFPRWRPQ